MDESPCKSPVSSIKSFLSSITYKAQQQTTLSSASSSGSAEERGLSWWHSSGATYAHARLSGFAEISSAYNASQLGLMRLIAALQAIAEPASASAAPSDDVARKIARSLQLARIALTARDADPAEPPSAATTPAKVHKSAPADSTASAAVSSGRSSPTKLRSADGGSLAPGPSPRRRRSSLSNGKGDASAAGGASPVPPKLGMTTSQSSQNLSLSSLSAMLDEMGLHADKPGRDAATPTTPRIVVSAADGSMYTPEPTAEGQGSSAATSVSDAPELALLLAYGRGLRKLLKQIGWLAEEPSLQGNASQVTAMVALDALAAATRELLAAVKRVLTVYTALQITAPKLSPKKKKSSGLKNSRSIDGVSTVRLKTAPPQAVAGAAERAQLPTSPSTERSSPATESARSRSKSVRS